MYFDTHCHLNFKNFDRKLDEVINRSRENGVNKIVIPGTDVPTSNKAVAIADKYKGVYAAVGIHPHHVFELFKARERNFFAPAGIQSDLIQIESFLKHPKVVAVGEVGIDRHIYQKTKYPDYKIEEEFVKLQKIVLIEQIKLAHKYKKALIFHNREAKKDFLDILTTHYALLSMYSSVFHCCEPDLELLQFAKNHKMFIGVDGDIVYYKKKQEFIKTVPLEMLVLETDSPFLNPEPQKSKENGMKNEPKNIPFIAKFIAKLIDCSIDKLSKQTTENARTLFNV